MFTQDIYAPSVDVSYQNFKNLIDSSKRVIGDQQKKQATHTVFKI